MPQYFLDSSALVKRYREEAGSAWVLQLSSAPNRHIIARLSHVEVASAIVRRGRQSAESSASMASALATMDKDVQQSFQVVEFGAPLISRAVELVNMHALRAADAIQLACALLSQAELPAATEFYLVSADEELNAAAEAEGLAVDNPNRHL